MLAGHVDLGELGHWVRVGWERTRGAQIAANIAAAMAQFLFAPPQRPWASRRSAGHHRAGTIYVHCELIRVNRKLIFDTELKSDASKDHVSLPAPVVDVLRHHKVPMAAERLAAPIWEPWEGHANLVFPSHTGTPSSRVMCFGP